MVLLWFYNGSIMVLLWFKIPPHGYLHIKKRRKLMLYHEKSTSIINLVPV